MKTILLITALFLATLNANAQNQTSSDSTAGRSFIGASISTVSYPVMGKPEYGFTGVVNPYLNLYYGYKLSKRATIQLGLGYGYNEVKWVTLSRVVSRDSIYSGEYYQKINALVLPVTFKFTPFNPNKRLQLYANASIAPVLGHIEARATESYRGEMTEVLYDEKTTSLTLVANAGLTLNYKLSQRLDGYVDGSLWSNNLSSRRNYKGVSVGIGVNYRL
jgi:opacity protein-like surface antigen